jgi:hypothetical protein
MMVTRVSVFLCFCPAARQFLMKQSFSPGSYPAEDGQIDRFVRSTARTIHLDASAVLRRANSAHSAVFPALITGAPCTAYVIRDPRNNRAL